MTEFQGLDQGESEVISLAWGSRQFQGRAKKYPRAPACSFPQTINFVFPHGFSTQKGLRITDYPGLQNDADYQDYGLVLRLPDFDMNRPHYTINYN